MKKGYKSIISEPQLAHFVKDFAAMDALEKELLEQAELLPNRRITRKELERDLGFERSGLRLLEKLKWFAPNSNGDSRETYDLKTALRVRIRFSGFAAAPQIRTERKHGNITSVVKETFRKIVGNCDSLMLPNKFHRNSKKLNSNRLPRGQRTNAKKYYLHILTALEACGGSAKLPEVISRIEVSMKNILDPVDRQPMPSHPTILRWHNTAEWARYEMVKAGLLKPNSPRGVWEITETGKQFLPDNS